MALPTTTDGILFRHSRTDRLTISGPEEAFGPLMHYQLERGYDLVKRPTYTTTPDGKTYFEDAVFEKPGGSNGSWQQPVSGMF
jgi:hypothetical protein